MTEPQHDHGGSACPECGHSDRMHRIGATPKYAGCMERGPRNRDGRLMSCWCALTPAQARETPEPRPVYDMDAE
jgi:hypothetical protein